MTRWTVRRADTGAVLSTVETADIDYALDLARRRHHRHDLTVDDMPPSRPAKAVIRYLPPNTP